MRFSYGFTGSGASAILFSGKLYKFEEKKKRKSVARRHVVGCRSKVVGDIVQSPHGLRAEAVRSKRHGGCTVTAPSLRSLCTEAARAPYDFRAEAV